MRRACGPRVSGRPGAVPAAHAVTRSERAYEHVEPDGEPDWAEFIDPAYLHGEHANTFRDLEAAHAAGVRTLKLAGQVKSSRAVEAVGDLSRRMQPFGQHRLVADFTERARELAAAA